MSTFRAVPVLLAMMVFAAEGAAQTDAYRDEGARELVAQARVRRITTDRRISGYQTTAAERMSVTLRAGPAEKLLFRRETASRIDWHRDGPVNIEILAAREVVPIATSSPQIPAALLRTMPALAFDPVDSEMLLRFDSTVIRHPLAAGSEAHYTFATGDSTIVTLPDGRTVRLRELRIQPRRRDAHLMNGSFWIDLDTHAVVQAYFRLADSLGDGESVPLIGRTSAELDYIAIDYGLYDLRWWLPRTVAARGVMKAGRFSMPITYERRYSDYEVTGDTSAAVPVAGETLTMDTRPCRPRLAYAVQVSMGDEPPPDSLDARFARAWERQVEARDSARAAARDSVAAVRDSIAARAEPDTASGRRPFCDREYNVTTVRATELLQGEPLTADIYDADAGIISAEDLRSIAERVRSIPDAPWHVRAPVLELPLRDPGLIRYNRVEGVAPAVRLRFDAGFTELSAEVRYAFAGEAVRGELRAQRDGRRVRSGVALYRRLDVVDVPAQPFGAAATVGALMFGRDDNDYFDATGADLRFTPPVTQRQWYDVRVFAERQRAVATAADFSVLGLVDDDVGFRGNIRADDADQAGAVVILRALRGHDPRALRLNGEVQFHGEAGDYRFLRPSALLRATRPLIGSVSAGVEAAAGASAGDLPRQRLWQIGGAGTLRGYGAAAQRGDSYWRTRAELGIGFPAIRLAIFSDAGWAGPRADFSSGRPLKSVGAGIGLLDGLFRLDVARALDGAQSWRMHLQFNGVL